MSDECGNVLARRFSPSFYYAGIVVHQRNMCYFWRLTYPPKRIKKNVVELAGSERHVPEMIRTYALFVTAS